MLLLLCVSSAGYAQFAAAGVGVCPPFFLRDGNGNVINPMTGENADQPYSPRQTCGACHDYGLITQGYHFQQGADEQAPDPLGTRCQWVQSPGNYGGAWCSPAPLYPYLSPKHNDDPRLMDMTSFTFVTRGCGACHPGGGPLEYDREGKRYDEWMADPASGFTPGGENRLDGDYYQARWSESGVLEADCLLCHLPEYDFGVRKKQIAALNFRWAPTAAAGLADVAGAVVDGTAVRVAYDTSKFHEDGRISLGMVVSPRNETCLECHAQPGWKKRGADYRGRTDVHLRAGLRCVDCHPAGSRADDPRIHGREVHQIAKGDDPGGRVRDDLDNTMRDCVDCHMEGIFGAPVPKHEGLPALHLRRIACQTCHTPEKLVMPSQYQASEVFNDDAYIAPGGKQLWTFYGVDGTYRNHYGVLEMMGYDDKPTERFRPVLARYKGKIFPVNRVHSSWPGLETEGQPGLMQPRMTDIRKMWLEHREDPTEHPELAVIQDDNHNGKVEVNRPEEIDALISAVSNHLDAIGYPMEGKRVVWVSNDRVYYSGREFRTIETEAWEASAYSNMHKYNHDVQPARSALGAKGCIDCHGFNSPFFETPVLVHPFDAEHAQGVWAPNHEILGISRLAVTSGAFRESLLKPAATWVLGAVLLAILLHFVAYGRPQSEPIDEREPTVVRFTLGQRLAHFVAFFCFFFLAFSGLLFFRSQGAFNGEAMRDLHTWVGIAFGVGLVGLLAAWFRDMLISKEDVTWLRALGGYFGHGGALPAGRFNAGQKVFFWLVGLLGLALLVSGGALAWLRGGDQVNLSLLYTLHDLAALLFLIPVMVHVYFAIVLNPHSLRSLFGGRVSLQWLSRRHPQAAAGGANLSTSEAGD